MISDILTVVIVISFCLALYYKFKLKKTEGEHGKPLSKTFFEKYLYLRCPGCGDSIGFSRSMSLGVEWITYVLYVLTFRAPKYKCNIYKCEVCNNEYKLNKMFCVIKTTIAFVLIVVFWYITDIISLKYFDVESTPFGSAAQATFVFFILFGPVFVLSCFFTHRFVKWRDDDEVEDKTEESE